MWRKHTKPSELIRKTCHCFRCLPNQVDNERFFVSSKAKLKGRPTQIVIRVSMRNMELVLTRIDLHNINIILLKFVTAYKTLLYHAVDGAELSDCFKKYKVLTLVDCSHRKPYSGCKRPKRNMQNKTPHIERPMWLYQSRPMCYFSPHTSDQRANESSRHQAVNHAKKIWFLDKRFL